MKHCNKINLAMIQMSVRSGDTDRNLIHALELIQEAAAKGADLLLFPETMDVGWTHPDSQVLAGEIPGGKFCRELMAAAADYGIHICAGLTEREGIRVYNSAVLIDRKGNLVSLHRKLNELEIGHSFYAQGDRLRTVETEFGNIGLMICADATAPGQILTRSLCYQGADIILSPCAWAVPADYDNESIPYGDTWREAYQPVARDFSTVIAGVSNVGLITAGPWAGRHCIGCSLAVDAEGREIIQGPYGVDAECIIHLPISLQSRPARGCGWYERLDFHRKNKENQ